MRPSDFTIKFYRRMAPCRLPSPAWCPGPARGHLERAVEVFNKAIAIKPDYPEALYNLGLDYQDQGQLAEAVASYERALALKPDYAKAANNLGNALRDQGRLGEAVASYRRALVSKPDYSEAHGNLGNDSGMTVGSRRRLRATSGRSPQARSQSSTAIWAWRLRSRASSPRPSRAIKGRSP